MPEKEEPLYNLTKTPLGGKRKINFSFPLILIPIIVIGIISSSIFLFVNKSSSKTPQKVDKSAVVANNQPTQGQLFGVWGTVTKISDYKATEKESTNSAGVAVAAFYLKADNGKEYQLLINAGSMINKYQAATQKDAPKLLTKKVKFQELTAGDRVYVATSVDLQTVLKVPVDKVIQIDWHYSPVPTIKENN